METDIAEFLIRDPVRCGKLVPWLDDLVALRKASVSYRGMCRYLAEQDVTAGPGEVMRFFQRCGRQSLLDEPSAVAARSTPQRTAKSPELPKSG